MKPVTVLIAALAAAALSVTAAPVTTAFTYQGSLKKDTAPVSAPQDFQFGLYSAATGTGQVGTTVTLTNVPVTGGLFNVNLDFGAGAFGSDQRYLQIMVRPTGDAAYTGLSPRAAVMPAPVALSVAAGGVNTAAIQPASITADKLAPNIFPTLRLSLLRDEVINLYPAFPQFAVSVASPDFWVGFYDVTVMTRGIYIVSTHLTVKSGSSPTQVQAFLTRNETEVRVLSTGQNPAPGDINVLASADLVQLDSGDRVSIRVRSFSSSSTLVGDYQGSTTFNIVKVD